MYVKMWSKSAIIVALTINLSHLIQGLEYPTEDSEIPAISAIQKLPLGLSPYELHVIGDLLFELPAIKCRYINRVTIEATKKYIEEKIIEVSQTSEFSHPEFVPVYQSLVRCMQHLRHVNPPMPDPSATAAPGATDNKDNVMDHRGIVDALVEKFNAQVVWDRIQSKSRPKKNVPLKTPNSIFTSAWNWLRSIIGHSPRKGPTKPLEEIDEEQRIARKKELKKKEIAAVGDFQMLLSMLSRVVMNSCPVKHKPDHGFISKAIQEILAAVLPDKRKLAAAVDFYFVKRGLWGQVRQCTTEVEKDLKSTNSVDSDSNK
ncbi:unnamed protein product [Allacma fusca]|uniref:Uncharacterized protein n=1 Tax=Allacma fusca TaxID=39272 RepID=A0A8J2JT58_9HEXA|nr:unnamed protein product [Allacma fusca]